MFWCKEKKLSKKYIVTFDDGRKNAYDLSEVIFISQTLNEGIRIWFRNGGTVIETGNWNKAAIDELFEAWKGK